MKRLAFVIRCNPPKSTAQASARILKRKDGTQFIGRFADSKARHTQDTLIALLQPHVPDTPMVGPLTLDVAWIYPFRKSEPKCTRQRGCIPCDTRPDIDNLTKLLLDTMTRVGFWTDDAQIYWLSFAKYWGVEPGIQIAIIEELLNP